MQSVLGNASAEVHHTFGNGDLLCTTNNHCAVDRSVFAKNGEALEATARRRSGHKVDTVGFRDIPPHNRPEHLFESADLLVSNGLAFGRSPISY